MSSKVKRDKARRIISNRKRDTSYINSPESKEMTKRLQVAFHRAEMEELRKKYG